MQAIRNATVGRDILVDGYNVIKSTPSLRAVEVKNLAMLLVEPAIARPCAVHMVSTPLIDRSQSAHPIIRKRDRHTGGSAAIFETISLQPKGVAPPVPSRRLQQESYHAVVKQVDAWHTAY